MFSVQTRLSTGFISHTIRYSHPVRIVYSANIKVAYVFTIASKHSFNRKIKDKFYLQ